MISKKDRDVSKQPSKQKITVGIVRPISIKEPYKQGHWGYIHRAIIESLWDCEKYEFEVKLVSENTKSDIIQSTIIRNLYHSDVIVCDLSSLNPNVFFELGIRMAYRKPCVLLIDDKTSPPFDIAPIRYIDYPSSFHRYELEEKQNEIRKTVIDVYNLYKEHQKVAYSSFFTEVNVTEVADIEKKDLSVLEVMKEQLAQLLSNSNNEQDAENFRLFISQKLDEFIRLAKARDLTRAEVIEKGKNYLLMNSEINGYRKKLSPYIFDIILNEGIQNLVSKAVQFRIDFDDDIPF